MDRLLQRFISQLDSLILFLEPARAEAFEKICARYGEWFSDKEQASLPKTGEAYGTQIAHSAFLLGYSYLEAFLTDLVREIYRCNPRMLPNHRELKFAEVLDCTTYDDVLGLMIEKEVLATFYGSMENIVKYFEKRLGLTFPPDKDKGIVRASLLRNCIMHNMARADARLCAVSDWKVGDAIELGAVDVDWLGVEARGVARSLYAQAEQKFFSNASTEG